MTLDRLVRARPIHVELDGAVDHVTARGNAGRAMVRGDRDRRLWCDAAAEMVERFGVRVQADCLLSNHAQLVVGTPRGNPTAADTVA